MKDENKHSDIYTRKLIQKAGIETASEDFTDSVMNAVEVRSPKLETSYQPLFSKKTWAVIAAVIVGVLVMILSYSPSGSNMKSNTGSLIDFNLKLYLTYVNNFFELITGDKTLLILIALAAIMAIWLIDKLLINKIGNLTNSEAI